MTADLELSIVMPCLNEAQTLASCVRAAQRFLRDNNVQGEVIVADNGSSDGSQDRAAELGARVVHVLEKGYGAAIMGGVLAAKGRYVIMGDADCSYDFMESGRILEQLRRGFQLVMGNRFQGGIAAGAMPFLHKYLGNPLLSFIGRLFFKINIGDFHCGLRGFDRAALLALDLRTTGMEFASEMIVRAALHQLRIAEVPVSLHKDGRNRKPHLQTWRDGWRHLRFLLLYSPRWLYFYPSLAMIFLGLFIAVLLLPGPFMLTDTVGIDVHTLLVGAMSIVVGVQGLTFGLMARQYAYKLGILPSFGKYQKVFSALSVDRILQLAVMLLTVGVGAFLWAGYQWKIINFGALDYRDMMRVLIVSVSCIISALQLGFTAFMLGIMQIRQK